MSNITVTSDEFGDLIQILLLDAVRGDISLEKNERFAELSKLLEKRSAKPMLFNNYLEMDTHTRVQYKRLKKSLEEGTNARITIIGEKKEEETITKKLKKLVGLGEQIDANFDRELCKKVFKRVKDYRFKAMKPVTEKRLDRIIDMCIQEYAEEQESLLEENNDG